MGAKALSYSYIERAPLIVATHNTAIGDDPRVKSVVNEQAPWFWGLKEHEAPLVTVHNTQSRIRSILHIIRAIPKALATDDIAPWQELKSTPNKLEQIAQKNQKVKISNKTAVTSLDAYRIPEVRQDVISVLVDEGDLVVATIDTLEKWRLDRQECMISKRDSDLADRAYELTLFGVNSSNFTGLIKDSYRRL